MGVDTRHPLFVDRVFDWEQMLDTYRGQRRVKEKGTRYLPPTSTMIADSGGKTLQGLPSSELQATSSPGQQAYSAYLTRSVFPDVVRQAIEGFVGIMHSQPPRIELPDALEPLRENATTNGESLTMLLRQINLYQLLFGRLGLLAEAPDGAGPDVPPFIACYAAPRIINWDDGRRDQGRQALEVVVLDEGENERSARFNWEYEQKWRVLIMSDQVETRNASSEAQLGDTAGGTYQVALLRDGKTELAEGDLIEPSIAGNNLGFIPFTFVGTKDLVSDPDEPPLLGLSDLALTIYRGEADLRQALFMQGQETLVIIGGGEVEGEDETRVGAGQKIELPINGDAKYIGVSADGLIEMRQTLENDHARAAELGSKLLDFSSSGRDSGEALRIRMAAKTATIQNIAHTGAAGLEQCLRNLAVWIGANPDEVIVEPNLDFQEKAVTGREVLEWMQAKRLGAPITLGEIRQILQNGDLADPDVDLDTALAEIEDEDPDLNTEPTGMPDDDGQQNTDGDEDEEDGETEDDA